MPIHGGRTRPDSIEREFFVVTAILIVSMLGCGSDAKPIERTPKPHEPIEDNYGVANHRDIQFKDEVSSNTQLDEPVADLQFTDLQGKPVSLRDYQGRNVVLVITRGTSRYVCVYCSTLTSRLVAQYEEFRSRNAEVVVAFPIQAVGDKVLAEDFLKFVRDKLDGESTEIPFPIVLDMELAAVDKLGLRQNLARPATYILDARGKVRFAYVGASQADRPSIKVLLNQLDEMLDERTTPR
jgi:peroxiredoxin